MARSEAATVDEYLRELPEDRRRVVSAVRDLVLANLPEGYVEAMNWGMISYEIPLDRYPDTYNGQPLAYAAIAAQKNHFALYLMGLYAEEGGAERVREAFRAAGKKLDMGKSCVRFQRLDQLALDAIAEVVASITPERYIALYERTRGK